MKLSVNFTLAELFHSNTAAAHGVDNTPDGAAIENLKALVVNVLQPLRDRVGPLVINCGYRSPQVNERVGGKPNSQHLLGQAADIHSPTFTPLQLAETVRELELPFDQLIVEHVGGSDWLHISYSDRHRREALRFDGKSYSRMA